MSVFYTTGELAKHCGVSVRTVQYYDGRGILVPSELSEGGRRLYTEKFLYCFSHYLPPVKTFYYIFYHIISI